jgi:hypothetical protein
MPPRRYSRYTFCEAVLDDDGRLFLTERQPYRFRALTDNRQHVVKEADTLFSLAGHYFAPLPRPAGLWWIIADFQIDPIHDPTLVLESGRIIVVPSLRTVTEEIFSERRREDPSQ